MADIDDVNDIIKEISPYYKKKGNASREYHITYNSAMETLEPVYFWILDFMSEIFSDIEKIMDNFTATPGSGHFGELQQRASIMQKQAYEVMGNVNTIIRSVLNLIYSLKEFQMRLSYYEQANSDDKDEKEAGMLALKQIWLDNVDIKKGNTSIKALALSGQAPFVTLIDAFMTAKGVKDVDGMDLNDRTKRLLKPRIAEFYEWKKRSEKELRKRYQIERTYLKSQVNSLKLYTKWAKPYLKAAEDLRMKEQGRNPDLVNIFNSVLLELTILGKIKADFEQAIIDKDLPQSFAKIKKIRDYYSCVFIDFSFRGIPQRYQSGQSGHYAFGGKVDVTFRAYALNEEELKLFYDKLEQTDLKDSLRLVEGMTEDSLKELHEDIEAFLKEEEEEKKPKKNPKDTNPFSALFSFLKPKSKSENKDEEKEELEKLKEKGVKKDSYPEEFARQIAEDNAISLLFTFYDVYKKAHGMASTPGQV